MDHETHQSPPIQNTTFYLLSYDATCYNALDSEMYPLMKDEFQYYWENNKAVVGMQYRINRLRHGAGYTLKVYSPVERVAG